MSKKIEVRDRIIVGICGKICSGKDTVADYLSSKFHFNKLAFATKVKDVAKDLFNIDKKDERGRHIYQQVGGLMRQIDSEVWVNALFKRMNRIRYEYLHDIFREPNFVISDVRYPNEAKSILKNGLLIILDVDSETRRQRCQNRDHRIIPIEEWKEAAKHGSETGVDDIIKEFGNHKDCFVLTNVAVNTTEKIFSAVRKILNLKCENNER